METEYLDEEQVISLYNKVRTGNKAWPTGIWSSPAALQYAVTIFDYWIHNVMGWKGWPDARGKVTPALLEEHRLADLVESVFVPEFGDDWLDFEVVLNESMRLSEDEVWSPEVTDRQERVEAAFEHAFEKLIGSPKQQPKLLPTYHRFRNHLLRMWSAFQEAQAEHDKAEREQAERFWAQLRLGGSGGGPAGAGRVLGATAAQGAGWRGGGAAPPGTAWSSSATTATPAAGSRSYTGSSRRSWWRNPASSATPSG